MSWMKNTKGGATPELEIDPVLADPVLKETLSDFRENVHAWSAAAYNRPRLQVQPARSRWQPAVAWALGCVLAAGGLSGALYERHHRDVIARLALQAREAQQRQQVAQQQRAADEDLLATVDNDISRDVPAAMEPLASLMNEDATQQAGQ